jgi:hypothetical protein
MPIDLHPPGADEIEVSLFGPGTGESLAIHLGQGKWMIVDSCQPSGYDKPVPLDYIESLGLNPAECVVSVVITHFHADHIKGMDRVVEVCASANIWISGALCKDEAIAYVMAHALDGMITDRNMPGTQELAKILKAIDSEDVIAKSAIESRVVFRDENSVVTALSPSDAASSQAKLDFAAAFSELEGSYKKLARKITPNLCAVALHVETNAGTILLGSDLECSNTPQLGWEAVVASSERPTTAAIVYKVSHHGSKTGHYEPVYEEMLEDRPLQILTTMNTHSLPGPEDVSRICSYGGNVFSTTMPKLKPPKRDSAVEKIMKGVVKSRKIVGQSVGHIQLRMSSQGCVVNSNGLVEQLQAS